ncbi:ammonium transporter NrgA [bacterium BMS3Bbin10]|nr:ammonium transporter NrgA [bacterium BMS3Bbin10]
MTLPGLALFYGGLVQSKNILSVLMQCAAIACLAPVLWIVAGYSLAFSQGNALIGGLSKAFLIGVTRGSVAGGTKIPETLFIMFQMTFAIITPALIVGAYVERIKFSAVMLFSGAVASLVWMVIEWIKFGKPSLVGLVTGTIAGLATITPASGFVGPAGGIFLGLAGGFLCYYAVDLVKSRFRLDDSLDVLAVQGVCGLRVSEDETTEGLDFTSHGGKGYHF